MGHERPLSKWGENGGCLWGLRAGSMWNAVIKANNLASIIVIDL